MLELTPNFKLSARLSSDARRGFTKGGTETEPDSAMSGSRPFGVLSGSS